MKNVKVVLLVVVVLSVVIGTVYFFITSPYTNPNVSKAISEKEQIELMIEQNKILERIAIALEKK